MQPIGLLFSIGSFQLDFEIYILKLQRAHLLEFKRTNGQTAIIFAYNWITVIMFQFL